MRSHHPSHHIARVSFEEIWLMGDHVVSQHSAHFPHSAAEYLGFPSVAQPPGMGPTMFQRSRRLWIPLPQVGGPLPNNAGQPRPGSRLKADQCIQYWRCKGLQDSTTLHPIVDQPPGALAIMDEDATRARGMLVQCLAFNITTSAIWSNSPPGSLSG